MLQILGDLNLVDKICTHLLLTQICNTYWRFNNYLLGDKEYVRIVKEVIFNVVQQYAAKGYKPVDSDNISQTDIKFSINDQLFMEVLLMEI